MKSRTDTCCDCACYPNGVIAVLLAQLFLLGGFILSTGVMLGCDFVIADINSTDMSEYYDNNGTNTTTFLFGNESEATTATTPTTDQLKIRKLRKEPAFPRPWDKFDGGSSSAVRIKRKMMEQQQEVDERKNDALQLNIRRLLLHYHHQKQRRRRAALTIVPSKNGDDDKRRTSSV